MESERDHLICDENGYAQTKMLPYGIYVVHQTAGWENTEWMEDFEVNVCENEKDYFYIINDAVLTSHVKIVKKGGEPPLVIVAFARKRASGNQYFVSQLYAEFVT